jgi:hypothetical protein
MEHAPDEDEQMLAVGIAIQGVRHCLHVCGLLTPAVQNAIIAEGFADIRSLAELREKIK